MSSASNIKDWRSVPAINGRLATEADMNSGLAMFHQGGGGKPYLKRRFPALATVRRTGRTLETVVVVQIEQTAPGQVVCGVRYFDGSDFICMLEDLKFQEKAG